MGNAEREAGGGGRAGHEVRQLLENVALPGVLMAERRGEEYTHPFRDARLL